MGHSVSQPTTTITKLSPLHIDNKVNKYESFTYVSEIIRIEGNPTHIECVSNRLCNYMWNDFYIQVELSSGKILDISPLHYKTKHKIKQKLHK